MYLRFILLLLLLLIQSALPLYAATPAGTVINNTANLNYQVNGAVQSSKSSNTNQFTVIGSISLNQGDVSAPEIHTQQLYPSNRTDFDITLTNAGLNHLDNGTLSIRLPANLDFTLIDENGNGQLSLQSQSTFNGLSTYLYTVDTLNVGTQISYRASIQVPSNFQINQNLFEMTYQANSVEIAKTTTTLNLNERTQGILQLLQYSADQDATLLSIQPTLFMQPNGHYSPLTSPIVEELGISATATPIPVKPVNAFKHNQIIFIQLNDGDHNTNSTVKDTIEIDFDIPDSSDTERLKLTETDVNSGVFSGYITLHLSSTTVPNNGELNVQPNNSVKVTYTDDVDHNDSITDIILVDPYGLLFDSSTGALLNGYSVSMINTDTGQPAQVVGDDGISAYPATVITGGSVTDSSGTVYNFSDGAYRFPFAPVGNYKLVVTPPSNSTYTWPSKQPNALINQLPNAPYALTLGSRGEVFPLTAGPPLHIDIPLDRSDFPLYVRRSANLNNASAGDFILFTVQVENIDSVAINQVALTDTLPKEFRLESDSVQLNDQSTTPPALSKDGRTLTFSFNSLAAGEILTLKYVVAVGAVKRGRLQSSSAAQANGGATHSNTATLNTFITEELMRSRAILMGQVAIEPNKEAGVKKYKGIKGIRIYMEDGRYALTDERGMYHFDNVTPGTHVVQLDLDTLPPQYEASLSHNNTRFAGRAWSQFVDIQGGTLWRSNFYVSEKPKPKGDVSLQIQNSALQTNDTLTYTISLKHHSVKLKNRRLTVMIPKHTAYQSGSSFLNKTTLKEPTITGNMLVFRLSDSSKKTHDTLKFTIQGVTQQPSPELMSKAFLMFDSPDASNQRTPVVSHATMVTSLKSLQQVTEEFVLGIRFNSADDQLNTEDKRLLANFAQKIKHLKNLRIHAIGHSDNRSLLPKTKLRFKDNYHLSANRATVIANTLRDLLHLPPSHITVEGRGPDKPISSNATRAGQRENRRVQLVIYSDQNLPPPYGQSTANIQAQQSERLKITTYGSNIPPKIVKKTDLQSVNQTVPETFNQVWLSQQPNVIKWLYPQSNQLPNIASTRIVIQHNKHQRVTLLQNGSPVDKLNFEGAITAFNGQAMSIWKGVDLKKGSNYFEAIIYDKNNQEVQRLQQVVHLSTQPVKAEVMPKQSILVADGIKNPVIAIRLLDQDGYPVRKGVKGKFNIPPPYQVQPKHNFNTQVMPSALPNLNEYHVDEAGIAYITLKPTTESGEIELTLPLNNQTVKLQTQLKAETTPWILVGLANGTVGYETLTKKSVALTGDETQNHLYQDNRIAFFAKGQIKGEWLLTLAYDSQKERPNQTDPELFQTIDPDTYYTLYGDTAYNGYAAPSSEKLYLKLEHDQFYFLFGDYRTDLNKTQLAKYNRTLTGVKTHYNDETFDVMLFASNSNQAFVKDEFRGKGLTGPYPLTRNNIAMNSEKIIIETRDRWRSEVIISTTELRRYQDYQIDYQTGIISFRTPVYSTDLNMNPNYIVVKYESFDSNDTQMTYGGRAKVAVNDAITLGVSHINEGQTGGEASLDGIDITYQITEQTKLRVEAARTQSQNSINQNTNTKTQGNAYVAELEHQTQNTQSKLYLRDQEQGFGLGQTNASENGLQKIGVETRVKVTENLNFKGLAYQQKNTSNDNTRSVVEAEAQTYVDSALGKTDLRVGLRSAQDQLNNVKTASQQITAGIRQPFFNNKLTTSLLHEQNLNSGDNSIDFPNRTRLGASYRVTPKTSLFIEQELTDGTERNTRNTLIGVKASPWNGGEIYSGVTQTAGSENSTRSNVSARQTWQLNDQWRLDLGVEDVSVLDASTVTNTTSNSLTSPSNSDFTASSIGLAYAPRQWLWNARMEALNGKSEDSWKLATSVQTNPNTQLSTLTTLAFSNRDQSSGIKQTDRAIRLGLAYRPMATPNGNWLFLNKLDLKSSDVSGSTQTDDSWRIINNFNANYQRNRWQLAWQYAIKTVNETLNGQRYNSLTDLIGVETRYDITPKWDVGLHANVLRAIHLNQYDYNTGFSVGRTVADNIWLSVGYNLSGFQDDDFSRSNSTNKGLFLRFRIKFDQTNVQEAVKWIGQ
jgi:uncharacterized repeat protein (TIGR01451 family)